MLNKEKYKISVIIPLFNAERFIAETILNVMIQDLEGNELELIVVDDGSTDNSVLLIENMNLSNLTLIRTPNQGVSKARNLGILNATGDFIQFLDADDILEPNKLKIQVNALIKSGKDVAYGDWVKYQEDSNGLFSITGTISREMKDDPEIELFKSFWCPPAALLFKKEIVDKIGGFNESLPIIQDARFFFDSALVGGTFIYTPGIVAKYRISNSTSLSRNNSLAFINDCFTNAIQVLEIWKKSGLTIKRKNVLLKVLFNYCRFYYIHDKKKFLLCWSIIQSISLTALPERPVYFRFISKLIGYPNAEHLAGMARTIKSFIRGNKKRFETDVMLFRRN